MGGAIRCAMARKTNFARVVVPDKPHSNIASHAATRIGSDARKLAAPKSNNPLAISGGFAFVPVAGTPVRTVQQIVRDMIGSPNTGLFLSSAVPIGITVQHTVPECMT
jgi:hypothetical protein